MAITTPGELCMSQMMKMRRKVRRVRKIRRAGKVKKVAVVPIGLRAGMGGDSLHPCFLHFQRFLSFVFGGD